MADKQKICAFYLKYRPKSLDDLVGQDAVKRNILASFQNNRLSHAYLFVGPRGTGKTSTARILAKMVNCELVNRKSLIVNREDKKENDNRYTINDIPCNKCSTCLSIADGSNLDLIEIDAASNRGIEDIRSLREKVKLSPTRSKKKVYIIDEVHMLTTEAFNALLKTLEEPPSHALFILATTEGTKIPQTILSRVQRLDFKLATMDQLLEALEKIVKAERIDIEESVLRTIAKKGEGSFRDSIKLLDQLSSHKGKIDILVVEQYLKPSSFAEMVELLDSLAKNDAKRSLAKVSEMIQNGIEPKELVTSLMEILRNLAFIKNGLGEQLVESIYPDDKYQTLLKLAESFSNKELIRLIDIAQRRFENLKFTTIPSLSVEVMVLEICEGQKIKIDQLASRIEQVSNTSILANTPDALDSTDTLKIKEKWTYVCETIRPYNFSLEALLRSINVIECTDATVVMEVPYSFHQRILEAPKNREILESILSEILGRSIRLSTVLGSRPAKKADIANIELAEDDEIIRAAAEIFNSDTVN